MPILEKTSRFAAIVVAVLFIGMSLFSIFAVWFVDRRATDVALKGFGLVETGVGVVNAGVERVDDLIATSRTEVRQASETVSGVGTRAEANGPVLNALNERLVPRIAQMQQALAPVRDAVGTIQNAVSMVNSVPMMAESAPRLVKLDETFNRLEALSADATQLRATMRALVVTQTNDVKAKTIATLSELAHRIDTRLGEVQTNVHEVQAEVAALQVRLDTRKSRVLFVFNLLAVLSTLMLAWILYAQIVVIQYHRARMRRPVTESAPHAE